jgi:hypothetical protein
MTLPGTEHGAYGVQMASGQMHWTESNNLPAAKLATVTRASLPQKQRRMLDTTSSEIGAAGPNKRRRRGWTREGRRN